MNIYKTLSSVLLVSLLLACTKNDKQQIIFKNNRYTVFNDEVVQDSFKAVALSPTEIQTSYQSPANVIYSPQMRFKFSINSRDNEFPAGVDHALTIKPADGKFTSPEYVFGIQQMEIDTTYVTSVPPNTAWTVRVDMRDMIDSFRKNGKYTTPTGDVIFQEDFKGVYIAGSGAPLTWDFENLYSRPNMTLHDTDSDGIYEATIILNPEESQAKITSDWKLANDISRFPQYQSSQLLIDALYNLSLDETITNISPDGTLRTGEEWDGVWTRDVSYSIYLAMAYILPDAARKSLMAKVKNNRIIQDTGTGGAWPVSSDRVVWSIAAWELYKYTGDKDWLKYAYSIIKNTAIDDQYTVKDPMTNLMRGEQSYLDWREQTYPRWMEPVDIYQSLCLGTNVLHYQMYCILGEMAAALGENKEPYIKQGNLIKEAIQKYLWIPDNGYFGQYLYGGINPILSRGIDNLGESLSILFDVASPEQAYSISANVPITPFGTTSIYPHLPNIKPYHNNAIWPFVQAYWNLACAKADNEQAVLHGLGAIYRAAALFATNKELFVASSGDFKGTAVNSDKMLWSISGNIAMIYRLYFGLNFEPDGIRFSPYVPESINGNKTISNFNYRKATLNIHLKGFGNQIKKFMIDGKEAGEPFFSANLEGKHTIDIELENIPLKASTINQKNVEFMPETTVLRNNTLTHSLNIENFDAENMYVAYIDGQPNAQFKTEAFSLPAFKSFSTVGITAINSLGLEGFTGRPVVYIKPDEEKIIELENYIKPATYSYQGYSGKGFIETSTTIHTQINIPVYTLQAGKYYIDVRYANGSGPINTQNKCAIRSLFVNNQNAGALVMPQRGEDEWSNWGYSNPVLTELKAPENQISIRYVIPQDVNMNGEVNRAMIDAIRIRKADDSLLIPKFRILFPY